MVTNHVNAFLKTRRNLDIAYFLENLKNTNLSIFFSTFRVGSPCENFRLTVGGFSGNAGVVLILLSFLTLLLFLVLHCA